MKRLQADSSSPLYHQLMQRITADIERGTYPTGSRIPPEHELEQLYQVSRVTVRRALAELTSEGLLERKQGKGTFVSMPKGNIQLKNLHSFHDSCKINKVKPSTDVIHVRETVASKADTEELNLDSGSRVLETLRVRRADGVPVVLETGWSPSWRFTTFPSASLRKRKRRCWKRKKTLRWFACTR